MSHEEQFQQLKRDENLFFLAEILSWRVTCCLPRRRQQRRRSFQRFSLVAFNAFG